MICELMCSISGPVLKKCCLGTEKFAETFKYPLGKPAAKRPHAISTIYLNTEVKEDNKKGSKK